jgi:DNA modification methylase
MKTFILLSNNKPKIPTEFQDDDNRFSELLVQYFLEKYTKRGDKIVDPFAGLGTSMIVSEKIDRIPFGIESDNHRCGYIRKMIKHKNNIFCGSSLQLEKFNLPTFDLSITSPPYMPMAEKINPLRKSNTGYQSYLKDIHKIYNKLKKLMKKNAYVIIEVSNLKNREVTPLAWDIAREVSKVFYFEGEIIVGWESKRMGTGDGSYGYGYDHSYCLIFKNKQSPAP